jgi:hypothetical protein
MTDLQITITLPRNDLDNLVKLLGALPTSSGVYPILQNIVGQANTQILAAGTPAPL